MVSGWIVTPRVRELSRSCCHLICSGARAALIVALADTCRRGVSSVTDIVMDSAPGVISVVENNVDDEDDAEARAGDAGRQAKANVAGTGTGSVECVVGALRLLVAAPVA